MRPQNTMPVLFFLVGCESEETVVSEMEQALYDSQTALAVQLLSTELLSHTLSEPTSTTLYRHDPAACPGIERSGESPPFVLTLDYGDSGCVPESGLVPSSMSGHAVLEYDGARADVTFDVFEVGLGNEVSGSLSGILSDDGAQIQLEADLTAGGYAVTLDTTTVLGERVQLEGVATVSAGIPLTLESLELPWERIAPPCPAPEAGHTHLTATTDVEVDFAAPGGGFVTVTRKGRVSESVDVCGYRSSLF